MQNAASINGSDERVSAMLCLVMDVGPGVN